MTRRYEREILELLDRKEREHRGRERIERVRRNMHQAKQRAASNNEAWQRLGALRWTIASLVLALLAFIFHTTIPNVTNVAVLIAAALFFVPIFFRPSYTLRTDDPLWRGQRVDPIPFPQQRGGPLWRIRHLFGDGRRNRDS